ncbi:acyltransferase, partial [Escherichia coli]|nr:acyltransferase [Escherichia coli]
GDYVNDKNFKRRFQRWLKEVWEEKDFQLTEIMRTKGREER